MKRKNELDMDLDDSRMLTLDEMMRDTSIFPAISNNSLGKATNHLIKSLLNNIGNTPIAAHSNSVNHYSNQKRAYNNNNYHSLPPIGPLSN